MPLISVIIPTYRRNQKMLKRSLLSVLNQTYHDIEVILIDDNIDDFYSSLVNKTVEDLNDARITVIKNENNIGGAASRNKGAKIARGKYLSFLDDDDFYLLEKIEKQVNYIESEKYDFIISNLAIVGMKNELKDIRKYRWFTNNLSNAELIIEHYKHHLTGTPTFLMTKEMFVNIGGFPKTKIGHEFFLVDNALKAGYQLGYLNEILTVAVIHDGERISRSSTRQKDLDNLLEHKINGIVSMKKKDRKIIFYRHYLTKAYTYFGTMNFLKGLFYLSLSFINSPKSFINELVKRLLIKISKRRL